MGRKLAAKAIMAESKAVTASKSMNPILQAILLAQAQTAIQVLLADAKIRSKVKPVCLEIFNRIKGAFIGDPDFE